VVYNLVATWVERRRRRADKECGGNETEILERVRKEIKEDLKLDYLVTGSWSLKASQEAANLLEPLGKGLVNVAVDSRKTGDGKFRTIPAEDTWNLTPTKKEGGKGSAFVYFCDNETVDGVEFPHFPTCLEPLGGEEDDERIVVADMSSNFLSRRVDVTKYGVIFGGAQKNIGITDTTLLIVRKSLLALTPPPAFLHALGVWSPPAVFNWPVLAKNNSLYNTIPIFSIFIAGEVMRGLLTVHGALKTSSQGNLSGKKADIIYDILDANPTVYQVCPDKSVRSRMNICWRIKGGDEAAEKKFLAGAEERGLQGLKGHRSVGGVRASNYNAVPLENIEKLAKWMTDFVGIVEKDAP